MKSILLFLFILSAPLCGVAQNSGEIASSEITFVYLSNDVDGSVSGFTSDSRIDLENPSNSVFKGSVATETIKTGNFLRDWSIRGGKYFDVDTYPTMSFESTSVSADAEGWKVTGDLTIKKTTKPITINFTRNGNKLTGTTTLYSSDFGINVKKKKEDNKVKVTLVFQLK
ncbi:YceI family protein [Flavobacteriaceae bacterium TP-CH-4]|uniref:YceI family protein n=1 Tax=Pelagihabitans pacificus TaxID=2696054 RepID=A0A967AV87_9FLAO|nr:YceI family protein [Pelagihabitans pacificus]NHF60005.1 YceI family protein [Pelagihabitans pacificus]